MTGGKSNFDPNAEVNSESVHTDQSNITRIPEATASAPTCDNVRPELKAYLDRQVGWWRQRSIRAHVAQCPACREEMESMRDFSDNLRSADAETLDPALRARILAAVPHTLPPLVEARPIGRNYRRPLFLAGAAASAALVGAVLYPALNSKQAFGSKSESSEISEAPTLNTLKSSKAAAASAPPSVAPMDMNGSVDTLVDKNEYVGASADRAAQAPAPPAGMVRNGVMPAAPDVAATTKEAKPTADKAVGDLTASARAFRSAPKSSPGGMRGKPFPKIAQDVTVSATLPVTPSEPAAPSNITVQVRDVETRSADVEQKALAAGGKVVLSALSTGVDKIPSATLTLKIPASRLENFLTQVSHLGQLQSRQAISESAAKADGETVKAKDLVHTRRQETLVPVTVNLKSKG